MKILSIDVGIKNLGLSIINVDNEDKNKYDIEKLEIINLIDSKVKIAANKISLIDIGFSLNYQLNQCLKDEIENIDVILIENQIGPIANRMNNLQGMITQYFIMKNKKKIIYVSSQNKLKRYTIGKKLNYNEKKKLSIEIISNLLIKLNDSENKFKLLEIYNSSKKKDDLADSLLQNLWYIENII